MLTWDSTRPCLLATAGWEPKFKLWYNQIWCWLYKNWKTSYATRPTTRYTTTSRSRVILVQGTQHHTFQQQTISNLFHSTNCDSTQQSFSPELSVRLRALKIDEHLLFENNIDFITENVGPLKCTYWLTPNELECSSAQPWFTFNSVLWCNMLTGIQKSRIINLEKLCLKIISPGSDHYEDRTAEWQMTPTYTHIDT